MQIPEYDEIDQVASGDLLLIRDVSTGVDKRVTVADLVGIPDFGWVGAGESWTYSAWDSTYKIGTIIIPTDGTTKYTKGMRIKITQSTGGTKYGIIVEVNATTMKVFFGTDYTLNNEAISSPFYTSAKVPFGFPADPNKWKVEITDTTGRTQGSPTQNTWYNLGTLSINLPIGIWDTEFNITGYSSKSAASITTQFGLSTANNSASDLDLIAHNQLEGASGNLLNAFSLGRRKQIVLTSNTPYYVVSRTTVASVTTLGNGNDVGKLVVRAVSSYL